MSNSKENITEGTQTETKNPVPGSKMLIDQWTDQKDFFATLALKSGRSLLDGSGPNRQTVDSKQKPPSDPITSLKAITSSIAAPSVSHNLLENTSSKGKVTQSKSDQTPLKSKNVKENLVSNNLVNLGVSSKQHLSRHGPITPGQVLQEMARSLEIERPSRRNHKADIPGSRAIGLVPSSTPSLAQQIGSYKRLVAESLKLTGSRKKFLTESNKNLQVESSKKPTSRILGKISEYCNCPDVVGELEHVSLDAERQFEGFKRSIVSQQPRFTRPKIRDVQRSPFERKDRAARAEFVKELEQMEIALVEKKQKLKPRRIKKNLNTASVYKNIKDVCIIPDSTSDSERGNPSCPSISTYHVSNAQAVPSYTTITGSGSRSSSNSRIDKIQLRRDPSTGGSRGTAAFVKEDAFHEIDLSEETDVESTSHGSMTSSSATETLSSTSEISLRVNTDRQLWAEENARRKARNIPYLNYRNKIKAEIKQAAKTGGQTLDTTQETVIIEKIATEFGEWAKENGLKPEAVEKDIIKELFQFGTMDTAANSIAVEIKELIIVPESITEGIYPELEERAAIYRQILFDEMAYWRTERSMAFNKPDPHPYKRPPQEPLPTWTKSGFVPLPLVTGELLYKTLIENDSLMLERYVMWMVENPKYYRPPYLLNSGYFQRIIDKHGGSEDVIRHKTSSIKNLSSMTARSVMVLNPGMKTELDKLKEMSYVDKKPKHMS